MITRVLFCLGNIFLPVFYFNCLDSGGLLERDDRLEVQWLWEHPLWDLVQPSLLCTKISPVVKLFVYSSQPIIVIFLQYCHVFCPCDYLHSCLALKEERFLASIREKNKSCISGNEKASLYLGLREVVSGKDGKQFLKKGHNLEDPG